MKRLFAILLTLALLVLVLAACKIEENQGGGESESQSESQSESASESVSDSESAKPVDYATKNPTITEADGTPVELPRVPFLADGSLPSAE